MAEFSVTRLADNPLLEVSDHPDLAENINGPSLIKVPDWVTAPLGRYYLYFSHHQGKYIRMAYADTPSGPYTVHPGGVLPLAESGFPVEPPSPEDLPDGLRQTVEAGKPIPFYTHIASPDVHVVPVRNEIRMYYHGLESDGRQYTRVAVSNDGLNFTARDELLGLAYFRVFQYAQMWYALAMPVCSTARRTDSPTLSADRGCLMTTCATPRCSWMTRRCTCFIHARGTHRNPSCTPPST